jgi:hypothetical protein
MATNYTVKIAGQTVTAIAGTLSVQNQIGQRSTGSLSVWSALGTYWSYGTQIQIYDETDALVYNGFISKDKATKGSRLGQGYLVHQLTLMDNTYKADKRVVAGSWLNATAGSIVTSILTSTLAAEGVTATASSIATGATITEVVWIYKRASEALNWLAQQSGYWWTIDVNNVLWFQPYYGVPAPFVLDGTQAQPDTLSVEYGNEMYTNRQFVKGATAETGILTENFKGDGYKRGFTLSYGIASTSAKDLSISVNGVSQTIGTKGSSGQQWYAAVGDAVVAQDPSQPVLSTSDTLTVTYKGRYPVIALASNDNLITAQQSREGGGTGYVESTYVDSKVHTQAAAFQIAGNLLGHYGSDMTVLQFSTRVKGLQEGQSLTVNLPDFGLTNKQMLISSVEITDGVDGFNTWYHVNAVGSPVDASQWQTFWQNTLNQQADPADLSSVDDTSLALLIQFTATLNWTGTSSLIVNVCSFPSTTTYPGFCPC